MVKMSEQDLMAKKIFEATIKFYKLEIERQVENESKRKIIET